MSTETEVACLVRMVTAPDGSSIPVPSGGLGVSGEGGEVHVRGDANVQIHASGDGYYVAVNNAEPSNSEAERLFEELSVETAITTLEHLASQAFAEAPEMLFKGAGVLAGVLVSVFTTTHLTREIFIRGEFNGVPITYCLLC